MRTHIDTLSMEEKPKVTPTTSFMAMANEFQRMIDALDDEKKNVDTVEGAAWKQANQDKMVDRSLDLLYGDVMKTSWMINPNNGQSSSDTIQRLELRQRKIELGQLPNTDDYAEVNAYFLYSETRQCVVWLTKAKSNPVVWDYAAHYVSCALEDAQRRFKQCQGRSVSALPQTATDKNAFADVDP